MKRIKIRLTFTEEILGTAPTSKEIYKDFIASKAPDSASREEEIAAIGVDETVEKARTVFSKDENGELILWDYQIKGFFKEACGALWGKDKKTASAKIKAYKKLINNNIFVMPRKIKIENIYDIGECQRPLRAATPQGERTALAISDTVAAGATITFDIYLMDDSAEDALMEWLAYGALKGLGQWRNSGKGSFIYDKIEEETLDFKEAMEMMQKLSRANLEEKIAAR